MATEEGSRAKFCSVHVKWRRYAQKAIRLETEDFEAGTIYPLINANAAARLFNARTADLRAWRSWARPEEPADEE